jgi:uncharacterized protein (DUF1501 family)
LPHTRRDFLKTGAFFVSLSLTAPAFITRSAEMLEAAALGAGTGKKILVVVQLSGGNDGLNTVVPFNDPLYATYRPSLALQQSAVLKLNDAIGLNPQMTALKARFDQGQVGVIQNVGYPNPNRSHFRSMDIWHTAEPATVGDSGWLGRYLDSCCSGTGTAASASDIAAWSIGSTLPLALWVEHVVVPTINSVSTFTFKTDGEYPDDRQTKLDSLKSLYAEQASPRLYDEFIRQVGTDAMTTSNTLATLAKSYTPLATFPTDSFGQNMKTISQLIAADLGTKIFYVSTSGFDTHANQDPIQSTLLGRVANGIDAFLTDMDARGRLDDVLIISFSEFGRRVKENSSGGTDHGTAAPMFVIGKPVKGGVYGDNPDLVNLDQGDLKFKIDFRSVYSSVLGPFLGGDANAILGGNFAGVPFLS